jgi:hypothetical protein
MTKEGAEKILISPIFTLLQGTCLGFLAGMTGNLVEGKHGGMRNSPNRSTMPSPLALDLY